MNFPLRIVPLRLEMHRVYLPRNTNVYGFAGTRSYISEASAAASAVLVVEENGCGTSTAPPKTLLNAYVPDTKHDHPIRV
jgi:hypothetical protein